MSKDNFLDHTFHDSNLKDIENEDNKTRLIIDTDIYWRPGKPFTILTLANPDDTSRIKELVGGSKTSSGSINELKATRTDSDRKNFEIKINLHSGEEIEINCYNFWTERKEEYKDYHNTTFR